MRSAARPVDGPEAALGPDGLGMAVYRRVRACLTGFGDLEVRPTTSQVAFRRRRGFADLRDPRRALGRGAVEVVLSIALPRADRSPRFKQVIHVAHRVWMHHLELRSVDEVDEPIVALLLEAASAAG